MVSKPTVISQSSIVLATPIPTLDPTADWKIYSSNKYGYQIHIPLDWKMLAGPPNEEDMFNFRKGDYELSLSIVSTTAKTIQEYLLKADKDSQTAWEGASSLEVISTKLTKINNYSVVRRDESWLAAAFLKPVVNTYFLDRDGFTLLL